MKLNRILEPIKHPVIYSRQLIDRQKLKHINQENLSKNLNLPGKMTTTFRRGLVRELNTLFNNSHKSIFKKEMGNILIKTGYEKDNNW